MSRGLIVKFAETFSISDFTNKSAAMCLCEKQQTTIYYR